MFVLQNTDAASPVLSTSPQSQFDLALSLLRHQIQQQDQPMTSLRHDVTRSATESLLLAALGLAVPAAGTEATEREALAAGDGEWTAAAMTADSRRYKTELCRAFEERGQCRYAERCQFAHGVAELRALERHPKYKTELCRTYHTSGYCPYGARCHFVHNATTPPAPPPTPRDVDQHHSDGGRSNSVSGRAVPDNIQLTLLSAALEKQAASSPTNTRPAVSITSCGAKAQQTPSPWGRVAHRGIARFLGIDKNLIRSSHGHSTPSLKISCKWVQPFSRNLANKETKKDTYKQTK